MSLGSQEFEYQRRRPTRGNSAYVPLDLDFEHGSDAGGGVDRHVDQIQSVATPNAEDAAPWGLNRHLKHESTNTDAPTLMASEEFIPTLPPTPPSEAPTPPAGPKPLIHDMSKAREIAFLCIISMIQILPQATIATVFPSSQIIGKHFDIANPGILPWTVAAYSLTFGTFILIAGRLGDIFGHKRLVIIGFCWFAFASLLAGVSAYSNFVLFFFARAFQGIGSAIIQPNGLALLGQTYAPGSKKKNMAFALFGAMAPTGAYLGMVFGAVFAELTWWPWMFFAMTFTCLLGAVLSHLILPAAPPTSNMLRPFEEKFWDMDWAGAVTGVSGLVCINIAWNCAPNFGWHTQWVFMLLIIGFIWMIGFFVVEMRLADQPLVPFRHLTSDVAFVLAAIGCGWASFGVWVYYFWQFLLNIRHDSPLTATAQFTPIAPLGFVAAILTGILMHTTKPSWILTWALLAFLLGNVFLAIAPAGQTYWALTFVSLLIMPFGMDMSFPAGTVIMSNAVPREDQGIAGSMISTVVNYSISLGLGFAATAEVYLNNGGRTQADLLRGYRAAWYVSIGVAGLGCLVCLTFLLKEYLRPYREKRAAAQDDTCDLCGCRRRDPWKSSGLLEKEMMTPTPTGAWSRASTMRDTSLMPGVPPVPSIPEQTPRTSVGTAR